MKKIIDLTFAQSIDELEFIKINSKKNLTWVPLNIETYNHILVNKLKYIDPFNFFSNENHKEGIIKIEKILNKIINKKYYSEFLYFRAKGILRKYLNSIYFIISVIKYLEKNYIINSFTLSGWQNYNFKNKKNNYFVSTICKNLINKKYKIFFISKNFKNKHSINYLYYSKKINFPKKYILFTNYFYNFKRIIYISLKKKIKIFLLTFENLTLLQKLIFFIFGIRLITFQRKKEKKIRKFFNFSNKNFFLNNYNLTNLIKIRLNEISNELIDLHNKSNAIKEVFKNSKPNLAFFNYARGIDGFLNEFFYGTKTTTVTIPHGTLTKGHNLFNNIYQKIISEELIHPKTKFVVSQSKFGENYLNFYLKKKNLKIGNILFTENKSEPGKYILYAVTARDFVNMQFYGIQTFFEIYKNLRDFNLLAKQKKFLFLIRLHPNISHCSKSLSKVFPYLKFHLGSLDDAVKKSFVTISFSSTVIEDTLNSGRPIILYDEFNRYSHYDSKKKNKRNNSIYFLNHLNDLERVINLIKLSDKIKFKDYISSSNSKKNIEKILKKFLFK